MDIFGSSAHEETWHGSTETETTCRWIRPLTIKAWWIRNSIISVLVIQSAKTVVVVCTCLLHVGEWVENYSLMQPSQAHHQLNMSQPTNVSLRVVTKDIVTKQISINPHFHLSDVRCGRSRGHIAGELATTSLHLHDEWELTSGGSDCTHGWLLPVTSVWRRNHGCAHFHNAVKCFSVLSTYFTYLFTDMHMWTLWSSSETEIHKPQGEAWSRLLRSTRHVCCWTNTQLQAHSVALRAATVTVLGCSACNGAQSSCCSQTVHMDRWTQMTFKSRSSQVKSQGGVSLMLKTVWRYLLLDSIY